MKESSSSSSAAAEKCLDSQLWHACAGGMVQLPVVNSMVYYFPQGHAEHAHGAVDFGPSRIPPIIPCRVTTVKFMADPETDEVFAKIRMNPVRPYEPDSGEDDATGLGLKGVDPQEKPACFSKTLTQSDANNGGGFSVPRYCAETLFPGLDYSTDPPVQTVLAKDVHGEVWKFRHIYRGTPRRHLLTTGWSTFVNQKKLVAGDSIVFLRAENGDLCVGIRRVKRGGIGGGLESLDMLTGWNPPPPCASGNAASSSSYEDFSAFLREEENKILRANSGGGSWKGKGKVTPESVAEAAALAASWQPFEVEYYPRANTPEFCVKEVAVKAAMKTNWCAGMRFKMAFETEDSARISWFMGTISAVQYADPIRWPNSPWRQLQVTWDEPGLLQNVKSVSPWLVELVANMPGIHLTPFSPPRKRPRIPQHPDFPLDSQYATPMFPGNHTIGPSADPLCFFPESTPAGIQGARHAQFGLSLSDHHFNNLHSGMSPAIFHQLDHNPSVHENVSCLLTIGNSSESVKQQNSSNGKPQQFVLFGQLMISEQQMSASPVDTGNSSSEGNFEKVKNSSDVSGSSSEGIQWHRDCQESELGLETGHCKVFMESEDVGCTLDLSVFGSYEELYSRLAGMFGIEKSEIMSHVFYTDADGTDKHTGDEPFSEFMGRARRLIIQLDVRSYNIDRCIVFKKRHT